MLDKRGDALVRRRRLRTFGEKPRVPINGAAEHHAIAAGFLRLDARVRDIADVAVPYYQRPGFHFIAYFDRALDTIPLRRYGRHFFSGPCVAGNCGRLFSEKFWEARIS